MNQDRMRTMHDAILIGVGTALNDDPQLNGMSFPDFLFHSGYLYISNIY